MKLLTPDPIDLENSINRDYKSCGLSGTSRACFFVGSVSTFIDIMMNKGNDLVRSHIIANEPRSTS